MSVPFLPSTRAWTQEIAGFLHFWVSRIQDKFLPSQFLPSWIFFIFVSISLLANYFYEQSALAQCPFSVCCSNKMYHLPTTSLSGTLLFRLDAFYFDTKSLWRTAFVSVLLRRKADSGFLSGCPNGSCIVRMLADHCDSLGKKTIESVRLINSREPPVMYFGELLKSFRYPFIVCNLSNLPTHVCIFGETQSISQPAHGSI